jgi:LAO/AO transport system kinase
MQTNQRTIEWFLSGLRSGDRVVLGQAITLVESEAALHQEKSAELLNALVSVQNDTFRIGISGAPGVGKSTIIEALGMELISRGHRVAVLAIDPTSTVTGGSILGDKTRMERLSAHPQAFIRPSPARTALGGVTHKTRETIALVEAAGYDIILVETVGVGQSEVAVHAMTDMFVLMLLPGAGDELQGIKRGIVELADLCVVNKADGDRVAQAKTTRAHYSNALHLFTAKPHGITVDVLLTSALESNGIDLFCNAIAAFRAEITQTGHLAEQRSQQRVFWWQEAIKHQLLFDFEQTEGIASMLEKQRISLERGEISAYTAAKQALQYFYKQNKK